MAALGLSVIALVALPVVALAHPLGNFTINHYAGVRVLGDRVAIDVVLDFAEIPALQARQRIDTDRDGVISDGEAEVERAAACPTLEPLLGLQVGSATVPLTAVAAGLSFPPGSGGLTTMRLVCELEGVTRGGIAAGTPITYRDDAYPDRIGWREIEAVAPRAAASGGLARRLTAYPSDPLAQPPSERSLSAVAGADRSDPSAWAAPDAQPLQVEPGRQAGVGAVTAVERPSGPGFPGLAGLEAELSSLVGTRELTPLAVVISMLVAVALGVVHALSPGHGKTIMAAYLVGRGGSVRHAVGLGLSVAVSHTIGVLALALITLLAADVLPPERLYPILGLVSGALVVVIGGSLLLARLRDWSTAAAPVASQHHHRASHGHGTGGGVAAAQAGSAAQGASAHGQADADVVYYPDGTHSHGGGRPHRHLPPAASGLSWRSLFMLGLSGGLVPSASALILLLGSIATGRVAYGLVLVAGFGAGMALVLGGIGLVVVRASSLLGRLPAAPRLGRLSVAVQAVTAALVVVLGVALAGQALGQIVGGQPG